MLHDLLSAQVTVDDLDEQFKANGGNVDFLGKFEKAWKEFVNKQTKENLPKGKRECRIENLQAEAREILTYRENLEGELREQRDFIRDSLVKSEDTFERKVRAEKRVQRAIHVEISQQLEYADKVHTLQKETLPWFHFLEQLNDNIEQDEESTSHENVNSAIRPSKRGFLLSRVKDKHDLAPAAELRAYRTDHAIMSVHVQMLTKEIERCEKLACLRKYASTFLNDQDVTDILEEYEQDCATLATDITEGTVEESHTSEKPAIVTKTNMTEASEKATVDYQSYCTSENISNGNESSAVSGFSEKTNFEKQSNDVSEKPLVEKKVKKDKKDNVDAKKKRAKGKVTKADEEILMALEKTLKNMGSMTDLEEAVKEKKKEKTVDISWSDIRHLLAHL